MSNWYKKAYNKAVSSLYRYLKKGFDPYDYTDMVIDYLEHIEHPILKQIEKAENINRSNLYDQSDLYDTDYYSIGEKWISNASPMELEGFKEYIKSLNLDPSRLDAPPYEIMYYAEFIKPTWLVHFSDQVDDISESGFEIGHDDWRNLSYTTFQHKSNFSGYNFAFKASNSRDIRSAANQGKYGKDAVVFWGSGVKATHFGDEEDQIVVWGPSVDTNMIFPIYNENGNWVFKNDNYKYDVYPAVESENIMDVIDWVIQNYTMAKKIK